MKSADRRNLMKINDLEIKSNLSELFLEDNSLQFVIPYFQRNYSWNKGNQIKTLIDDCFFYLDENITNKQNHFWGVIISKNNPLDNEIIIIDGQQRLTTILLVFACILNNDIFSKKNKWQFKIINK